MSTPIIYPHSMLVAQIPPRPLTTSSHIVQMSIVVSSLAGTLDVAFDDVFSVMYPIVSPAGVIILKSTSAHSWTMP
jgi:hypothetical protein